MAAANKAVPIPMTLSSLKNFTSQHSLSFELLLDFMNSNTYSGNYDNKKKMHHYLKINPKYTEKYLARLLFYELCYEIILH